MFAGLIWIASASSLINIRLLLYFETETSGFIERHTCTNIEVNPISCSLRFFFFFFFFLSLRWRKILYPAVYAELKHMNCK